jgi:hypothetical protein
MCLKIQQCVIFQKVFLFDHVHVGQPPELFEVWPAVNVMFFDFEVAALREQGTYGYVHQVLLLLFCELAPDVSEFLYADEKKYTFEVGLFAEPFQHFCFEPPPSRLKVILCLHAAKIIPLFPPNGNCLYLPPNSPECYSSALSGNKLTW